MNYITVIPTLVSPSLVYLKNNNIFYINILKLENLINKDIVKALLFLTLSVFTLIFLYILLFIQN